MFSCSEKLHRIGFERQHVLLDEGAGADAKALDLGRQREVHDFPLTAQRDHLTAVADNRRAGDIAPASDASSSSAPSRSPSWPKRPTGMSRVSFLPASLDR